ncbi:undecaprenyl-diphosphate phosphatase [Anoxybacillus ayderensis]|uniref:undecaprenyl-diphosphate phosphatase n=1 Tax=Anoxybacillus ayderensis TaxID=265546 RepID=UPI002E1CCBCF|nr:undecaprenyl-diphosphate phosphatase [Anoxybacillus ayderensis]MCL6615741.1 undecaprenyl-diphosphate phosphatase [Anoxybacillus ayderensis]MED0688222.1 undecaprenyl-diphosphate phosphatase [Anoxybacillus ayderensis]
MHIIELMKALILGLVEGVTEFAPVSSTGHMIIVDDMWLKSSDFLGKYGANTFKVVIQLGSVLAAVVVFKDKFFELLYLRKGEVGKGPRLTLMHIFIGLLPAGVLGVLFEDYIDEHLFSTETVLIGLVLGALLMIAADRFGKRTKVAQTVDDITYKQAFIVGLVQCLSLWPGFSRSGSTISGGVLVGMSHRAAADFTFIMAVPIMAGASAISLLKNWQYITMDALPFFIVGFISAFVFALLAIRFFLRLINRVRLVPFAIYRIVLAAVIYMVYFA